MDDIKGIIIIFDLTNENSYNLAKTFVDYIQKNTSILVHIFLLGNKCDLEINSVINMNEVYEFLKDRECINYFECSAKSKTNLEKIKESLECTLMTDFYENKFRITQETNSGSCVIF